MNKFSLYFCVALFVLLCVPIESVSQDLRYSFAPRQFDQSFYDANVSFVTITWDPFIFDEAPIVSTPSFSRTGTACVDTFDEPGEVLSLSIPFQDNEGDLNGGYARVFARPSLYDADVFVIENSFSATSGTSGTAQVQVCAIFSIDTHLRLEISLVDASGYSSNFVQLTVGNQALGVSDPPPSEVTFTRPAVSSASRQRPASYSIRNQDILRHQKISDTQGNFDGSIDSDGLGGSVAAIGDLNNDGVTDLAVGADFDDDGGTERGAVWILFMDSDGTVIDHQRISDIRGGFTGTLTNFDHFGISVAGLGDLDGDGNEDVVTGAWRDDEGGNDNTGAIWVLFLNNDGTVKEHQKINTVQGGFQGELDDLDHFGGSIANLGDLNGDGVVDLAVGAWRDDDGGGSNHGAVWILFMNRDGTVNSHQKISDTQGNFTATLNDGDRFGSSVANLGDVDGDGVIDLAVGSELVNDGGTDRGAVWILFMNSNGTVKEYQKISDTAGGFTGTLANGDGFGVSVAGVGDLNQDGIRDVAVGEVGSSTGSMWLLYLNIDGTVKDEQEIGEGLGGFGGNLDNGDQFGSELAWIGDIDGDGGYELAVGAPGDDDGGTDRGAVWMLFSDQPGTTIKTDSVFMYVEEGNGGADGRIARIGVGNPANPLWVVDNPSGTSGSFGQTNNDSALRYSLIDITEAKQYLPPSPDRPWFVEINNPFQSDIPIIITAVTLITDEVIFYAPNLPVRTTLAPDETSTILQTGISQPPLLEGYNIYNIVSGEDVLIGQLPPYSTSFVHPLWNKPFFQCCSTSYFLEAIYPDFKATSRIAFSHFTLGNGANRFVTDFVETQTQATGGMWMDSNADGLPDQLFIPRSDGKPNKLYNYIQESPDADGRFEEVIGWAGAGRTRNTQGATWGDYDNDGLADLYVANSRQVGELYRNNNGSLEWVSSAQPSKDDLVAQSASWADFNNDGYLDLFVAVLGKNMLYRNNGGTDFTVVTAAEVGEWIDEVASSSGGFWSDYDKDGDQDLFVTSITEDTPNRLYHNQYMETGSATFIDRTDAGLSGNSRSMSASWGDYDNDGYLDLFVANEDSKSNPEGLNWLYRNQGPPSYSFSLQNSSIGPIATSGGRSNTSAWGDIDNDGDLDLFTTRDGTTIAGTYPDQTKADGSNRFAIFLNDQGRFEEPPIGNYVEYISGLKGISWSDFNNDGYADMFLADAIGNTSLSFINNKDDDPDLNNWIRVVLRPNGSNGTSIGAKVTIRTNAGLQYREVTSLTGRGGQPGGGLIFGLHKETSVQQIQVIWPNGSISTRDNITEAEIEDSIEIVEPASAGPLSLSSPENSATEISITPTFTWTAAANAETYQFQLSASGDFSTLINDVENIEELTYTATPPLNVATQYFWRVRGVGPGGAGPWATASFTTVQPAGALTLSSPANNATAVDTLATFTWTAAENADTYEFQLSPNEDFSSLIEDVEGLEELTYSLSTALAVATQYFWRARGIGAGGPGPWASASFTTVQPPGAVSLASPENNAIEVDIVVTFTWTAAANADRYQLQLSADENFTTLIDDVDGLEELTYKPNLILSEATPYFWRVRGLGSGGLGPWASAQFTTRSPAGVFMLATPAANATEVDPLVTFSWTAAPNATRYHLQVSTDVTFSNPVIDKDDIETLTYTATSPLDEGTTYSWRVRGLGQGDPGPWAAASFTTRFPVPIAP